jgi:hypothetical protein
MEVAMYQDVCIFDWLVAMRLIPPPLHNAVRSSCLVSMHKPKDHLVIAPNI